MRGAKIFPAMALDANVYLPINLGTEAIRSLVLQCRTAKDVLIATNPAGTDYITLKSGTSLALDLEGASLDIRLGSNLLVNGTFTGNANGWTLGAAWQYSTNTVQKFQDGTSTLSQVPPQLTLEAGALYQLVFTTSAATALTLTPSVGGTAGVAVDTEATHTQYFVTTNTTGGVVFTPANTTRITLDDISLKRVTFPSNQAPIFVKGSEASLYLEIIALK